MAVITPEIIKKIRRIHIQTTHLAQDLLAGAYRSAFKGKGMEFEEVREYQPGDETRDIDWKVTARMLHPYVKTFREEREITVMLMVDISSSARFGSQGKSKSELIAELGAVIAFSAIKNNDKVGLILFSDRVEKYIPPKKGTRHVLFVIRELLLHKPEGRGTDITAALDFLGNIHHRSCVSFLISDFICADFSKAASLAAKKYDLISIAMTDPYELEFPPLGLIELQDLETENTALVDSQSPRLREHLRNQTSERLGGTKRLMNKIGAGFIALRTDQSYMPPLRKFFRTRAKERR